ncbi:hypothetical protein BRC79_02680 [Halobacteriales archaeon QH_8_67_27]|nr:MAG: hypothetical protein BRC79_02680 [Halobacteriales archaeon QH_8_67_27]
MVRVRAVGIGVALVVVLASAGCLGFLTGDQPLEFAANATEVDGETLAETEYRVAGSESPNRTLNSSEVRRYNRTVSVAQSLEGDFAWMTVYTTPSPTVGGRSVNPVDEWSTERLIRRLVDSTSGNSNVEFESNRSVEFLDGERTVSTYGATRSLNGTETNVTVHLATVEHDGDYVVVVAVHPERIDERSRVDALLAGLRHPPS